MNKSWWRKGPKSPIRVLPVVVYGKYANWGFAGSPWADFDNIGAKRTSKELYIFDK